MSDTQPKSASIWGLQFQLLHGATQSHTQVPDDQLPIESGSADLLGRLVISLVQTQACDRILVNRLQVRINVFRFGIPIERLEDAHSRNAAGFLFLGLIQLHGKRRLQSGRINGVDQWNATVSGDDDRRGRNPFTAQERKEFGVELGDRRGVCHVNRAVVSHPTDLGAIGREVHTVHPSTAERSRSVLGHQLTERHSIAPRRGQWLLLDGLDIAGEYTRLIVGGSGDQKHIVRMPGQRIDRRPDRFLDVLRHPPVILRLEIAHGDQSRSGSNSKLVLTRRPLDAGRRPVDPQMDQHRLPLLVLIALRPHVRIPVNATRNDAIRIRRPVNAHHPEIVLTQNVQQTPSGGSVSLVDVNLIVVR